MNYSSILLGYPEIDEENSTPGRILKQHLSSRKYILHAIAIF
jgi:hypothetical protein